MKLRSLVMLTLCVLGGLTAAPAADPAELASALAQLRTTVQSIPGLTIVTTGSAALSPAYYEINKVTPFERPDATFHKTLHLAGPLYKVATKYQSANPALCYHDEIAYDGRAYQRLDHRRRLLSHWARGQQEESWGPAGTPLDQFGFLAGFTPDRNQTIRLSDLQSDAVWKQALARARYLGPRRLAGQPVLTFEIRDAYDPNGSIACRYLVSLSPAHGYFPVQWTAFTTAGDPFWQYTVTDFALAPDAAAPYHYPRTATTRWICTKKDLLGQTLMHRTAQTESLTIAPLDPSTFLIDVQTALAQPR